MNRLLDLLRIYAKALGSLLAALLVTSVLIEDMFYGFIIVGPFFILFFAYKQIRAYFDFRNTTIVEVILWGRNNDNFYHRPYCPKVIGKEGNLRQFPNSAEAEQEGYRGCTLCFPKLSYASEASNQRKLLLVDNGTETKKRNSDMEKDKAVIPQSIPSNQKEKDSEKGLPEGNDLLASLKSLKAQGKIKPGTKFRVILNRDDTKEEVAGPRAEYFTEVFDEATYAKAKPHFKKALEEFKAADKSLKEFIGFMVDSFGENVIPYLKRFHQELKSAPPLEMVAEPDTTVAERKTQDMVMDRDEGGVIAVDM